MIVNSLPKVAALIALLVFSASAQTTARWITYSSVEGGYTVDLPVQPELSKQDANDADGDAMPQYLAAAADGGALFQVAYFDVKPPKVYNFDAGRDGMLKATNGTLISERAITLGKAPGREVKIQALSGDITVLGRVRYYVVGTRVYIATYMYTKDAEGPLIDAKAKKFFDSFSVKKRT